MSEKRIVVKLKYGVSASRDHGSTSSAIQPEYDWNYKRIVFTLFGVAGVGLLGYSLLTGQPVPEVVDSTGKINVSPESVVAEKLPITQQAHSEQGSSEPTVADAAVFQEVAKVDVPASVNSENIVRARFAWGIKDKEPTGAITSPAILQRGDSVALYFFSELRHMNGQTLTHEWSRNGTVAESKDFQVDGDRWRVFSSKQLNSDLLGKWTVAIRDSTGENLGEYFLEVLQPLDRR